MTAPHGHRADWELWLLMLRSRREEGLNVESLGKDSNSKVQVQLLLKVNGFLHSCKAEQSLNWEPFVILA